MSDEKRKILVLVEGARTDVRLMQHLLSQYSIDARYEIVSYCTNIYTLYQEMFEDAMLRADVYEKLAEAEKQVQSGQVLDADTALQSHLRQ